MWVTRMYTYTPRLVERNRVYVSLECTLSNPADTPQHTSDSIDIGFQNSLFSPIRHRHPLSPSRAKLKSLVRDTRLLTMNHPQIIGLWTACVLLKLGGQAGRGADHDYASRSKFISVSSETYPRILGLQLQANPAIRKCRNPANFFTIVRFPYRE